MSTIKPAELTASLATDRHRYTARAASYQVVPGDAADVGGELGGELPPEGDVEADLDVDTDVELPGADEEEDELMNLGRGRR